MESPLRDRADPGLRLIETMRWTPGEGVWRLDLHMARLQRSANALGFRHDPAHIAASVSAIDQPGPTRLRLTLGPDGDVEITSAPFDPAALATPVPVAISPLRLDSANPLLRHKTTRRQHYDAAFAARPPGTAEALLTNETGALCEGTFTNLFVELADGRHVTPALDGGLLPGILRQCLLDEGRFTEARIASEDLQSARQFWIGNALRGLLPALLIV